MRNESVSKTDGELSRRDFLGGLAAAGVGLPLVSAMAACGGGGGTPATPTGPVRLTMIIADMAKPGHGFAKLLDDYNARGRDKVDYQFMPPDKFVALFTAAQSSSQEIDVVLLNGQDLRRYATNGTLLPLESLIGYKSRFLPRSIQTFTINGHLWGVPSHWVGGFPVLVNQKILDDIGAPRPKTYDDLLAINKELSKKGVSTFTHPGKNKYLWPVWFFSTYAQVTGNQSEQRTVNLLKSGGSFNKTEVVEALDLVFKFSRDGLFAPDLFSVDNDGAIANMAQGKAAFWLANSGNITAVRTAAPNPIDLGVQLLPRVVSDPKVKSQFPGGTGGPICLYHKIPAEKKQAALKLIDYLTSDVNAGFMVKDANQPFAVNVHVQGSTDPAAVELSKLLDQISLYLDWFYPPEVTAAFQDGIQAGVAKQKTAQEVAQDVQAAWQKVQASGWKFAG